ncbi:MAG: dihydroorotase family protein [Candidatus Woesearchaeota archaeon]
MAMDLKIKNARLMRGEEEVVRNIYIKDGKIKRISEKDSGAGKTIDAQNNFVIPGVIDPHVHFREPGLSYKEDLGTGSRAAAAGGITTFLDMPNTIPPTLTYFDLEEKRFLAKKSIVNHGFYIGASRDNLSEIRKENSKGNVAGTKLFMNLSTGKMMIEDADTIRRVFDSSKLVAVHAEGPKVEQAILYSMRTKTPLYLCHISSADELEKIREYRKENEWVMDNVFAEATPHHLFLTERDFREQGAFAKMIPSLKKKRDQNALWKALEDGTINTIGTDHAPHTIQEKGAKKDQPAGVPGEETMLPLMLDAVNRKKLSLKRLVQLTSKNPAAIFGIRNKGGLGEGYDADLTIIDMDLEKEVDNAKLKTKCGWSPFSGRKLKGWPVTTIAGGKVVFSHGKLYKNQGRETFFRRQK